MSKRIVFVHQGKAHLPELRAYASFFAQQGYEVVDVQYKDLMGMDRDFVKESILWYFMGFYHGKMTAKFIIHDYRSLSTGRFPHLKDYVKKYINHKPDLRVFLNEKVQQRLSFGDRLPYCLIDMGLPKYIANYREISEPKQFDFVYSGVVSRDRDLDKVIESFIKAYGKTRTLLLIGRYEESIKRQFEGYENIIFYGQVEQSEVFKLIQSAEYALCIIPCRYPHLLQTPTKLIEYLALGAKIIANPNPMVIEILKRSGNMSKVFLMDNRYCFPPVEALIRLKSAFLNVEDYLWDKVIKRSGILDWLKKV